MNLTIDPAILQDQQTLNLQMNTLAKDLIASTKDNQLYDSPFSFAMPLVDPNRKVVYKGAFAELINHLTQLFTEQTQFSNNTMQYNYEGFHTNITDFYDIRTNFYKS
jgi:hypothetical protein